MILNDVNDLKIGSQNIDRLYVGNAIVWNRETLPQGYTRCKYLEQPNPATCCIDTLVYPSDNMKFDTGVYFTSNGDDYFCSIRINSANTRYYLLNKYLREYVCTMCQWLGGVTASHGFRYDISSSIVGLKCDIEVKKEGVSLGKYTNGASAEIIPDVTLPLFGAKLQNSSTVNTFSPAQTRCYYAKFTDNGIVVRNLIPCLDSNGVPCMYDTVSRQPFYNQGTGNFLYELA